MLQFAALGLGKGVAALLKERSRVSPKKPTIWGLKRAFSEPGIALEITVLLSNTTCCLQQFIFKAIQKRLPKYNHEQIQELSISFPGSRHPDTWQDPGSYRWAQYNPCAQEQMWSYVYKRSHRPPAIGDWVQAASQEFMGVEKWVAQSSKLIPSLPPSLASARTFCRQGNTFNLQLQEITDGDIPLSRGGKRVLWDAPGKEVATSRVSESRATKALPEQTWFPLCEERFRWMKWASKRPLDKKKKEKRTPPVWEGTKREQCKVWADPSKTILRSTVALEEIPQSHYFPLLLPLENLCLLCTSVLPCSPLLSLHQGWWTPCLHIKKGFRHPRDSTELQQCQLSSCPNSQLLS